MKPDMAFGKRARNQDAYGGARRASALAVALLAASLLALSTEGAAADAVRRAKSGGSQPRPPSAADMNSRIVAERIDRREPGKLSDGVMRFGDTEIRVNGRTSFSYGVSGR